MVQRHQAKNRLLDVLLALVLLLVAHGGDQPGEELQAEVGRPTPVKEPRIPQRLLAFFDQKPDGGLVLPTKEEVQAAVGPSRDPRVREQSMKHVLGELERTARQSDSRMRTAMTASAFALTVAGLLLKGKTDIDVPAATLAAGLAFFGVVAGMFGHNLHVGRRPARSPCMTDVLNGRACLVHKEFCATLAGIFAILALLMLGVGVMVGELESLQERQTNLSPAKNTTLPAHVIMRRIVSVRASRR